MKKAKEWMTIAFWLFVFVFVVAVIALTIVAYVRYGSKPITEIPAWALLFMFGGRGGR